MVGDMKVFDFEGWELTQDSLKDVLAYNPETGEFHWLVKPSARVALGQRAGCLAVKGYRYIKIAGKSYQEHRLAWLYVYGDWPALDLDFINRDTACNKISNLRQATKGQNAGNTVARKDGLKGTHWHEKRNRWSSSIHKGEKQTWLGYFDTEEAAHAAYCEAAKLQYGEFFFSGIEMASPVIGLHKRVAFSVGGKRSQMRRELMAPIQLRKAA
jgi:hypothetical protein